MTTIKHFLNNFWPILLVLLMWQLGVSWFDLNALVLPEPFDVLRDIVSNPSVYLENGASTLVVATSGLFMGMAIGTFLAILISHSRVLSGLLTPISLIFASIPVVTIIPLLARIFGYGTTTVHIIVAVISFFPALVFTSSGLRAYSPSHDELFSVLGASHLTRLRHLYLPAAVPNWMIALRLTAPSAFLSAMVAEYLIGKSGFGFMFRQAASTFDTDRAFGASLVATAISIITFGLTQKVQAKVLSRWK
jgi:NitT/TauT family transport system permease protein